MNESHSHETCDSCKGGAAHATDHYALGRLRLRIGRELGLDRDATQQNDLASLMGRWAAVATKGAKK